jgi:L-alanine-DL-glutamate epimerase-like enolase superfamily enzyme
MHAIAALPLFLVHETNLNATPKGLVHAAWKDHNDGYVGLPSGPGLGVEVDERNSSGYQKCHPSGSGQSTAGSRMARSPIID